MVKKEILLELGHRIKMYRNARGLSQDQLSEKCELHRTYLSMVERGEKNLTITNLLKISEALKITPSDLLKDLVNK